MTVDSRSAVLRTEGLAKKYGAHYALEPVDVSIETGSIHGFLGKNGAGKSTLVGMIAGAVHPTAGKILHNGEDITATTYAERRSLGIHLLSQHAELVSQLSVAENLMMPAVSSKRALFVNWSRVRDEAREVLDRYRLPFDVSAPAGSLSLHDQRRLGIARTLWEGGSLAMLDEPTASLSRKERRELFDWVRELNAEGQTFVFISHYNSEIQEICDECTVFRDGKLVAERVNPRAMTSEQMSKLVTGAAVSEFQRAIVERQDEHVSLQDFSAPGVGRTNLKIARGQIVGFVGLPGSGSQELARALGGLNSGHAGQITVAGKRIGSESVRAAHKAGVAYLTNDRIHEGLVSAFSILESLHLGNWPTRRGLINSTAMKKYYFKMHERLGIRSRDHLQLVGELSGGNQQKVLLAAMLGFNPHLIILDEPTIGVDVGTKEQIHELMDELTTQGVSVILLTYDADEMSRVADKVYAFQDGNIAKVLSGEDLTSDAIIDSLAETTGVPA